MFTPMLDMNELDLIFTGFNAEFGNAPSRHQV